MTSTRIHFSILLLKLALWASTSGLASPTGGPPPSCLKSSWPEFKLKYGKYYASPDEDTRRAVIFCNNLKFIEEQNRRLGGSKLTANGLTDLDDLEFQRMLNPKGLYQEMLNQLDLISSDQMIASLKIDSNETLPKLVDWSLDPGIVGPIQAQGSCGACWAFATVGLIEGQQQKRLPGRKLIQLSAQQLIDCDYSNQGCDGGMIPRAIAYIRSAAGLESASTYPYKPRPDIYKNRCKYNASRAIETSKNLPRMKILRPGVGDEENLKRVLANYGPIAVMIQAGSVFRYAGTNVIFDQECVDIMIPNHAVLLVGYGTTPAGEDYWIVKNSWGEDWGSRGFGFMARNRDNNCGVATMPIVLMDD